MKICNLIYCLLLFNYTTYAQHDSSTIENSHEIFLNLSAQKNSFFSGPSIGIGYRFTIKQNFISIRYQFSEEFIIFGGSPQNARELSALYNFYLMQNKIISAGAGLAHTSILADTYNIMGPPPQGTTNRPSQIRKATVGFPLNINITIPSKSRFTAGFTFHANFNKYTNLYEGGILLGYRIS